MKTLDGRWDVNRMTGTAIVAVVAIMFYGLLATVAGWLIWSLLQYAQQNPLGL